MSVWLVPSPEDIPEELLEVAGGRSLIAGLLYRRGLKTAAEASAFLNPDAYTPADPFELPGMERAVARLGLAIERGETVCVWGDFDVDGQTATSLLVEALRDLGGRVIHHIPDRATESHGMNVPKVREVIERGTRLILTCDTGISDHEPIRFASQAGVDVIVTDHHLLPPEPPQDALVLINPQMLPEEHPMRSLPGVGVAYRLVEGLARVAGAQGLAERSLDLVALGIVADLAELKGDTRYFLQRGLVRLRETERVGLQALYDLAGIEKSGIDEETIAFGIAPRMNALGRLGEAAGIVDFLTTQDTAFARVFAARLEGLNEKRKMITEQIYQGALAQLDRDPTIARSDVLVVAQKHWDAGVVGIVASRLVEEFHKPAVVISLSEGDEARGSARSVEGVDITRAIAESEHLLISYGGHPMAGGLAILPQNIEAFRESLSRSVRKMRAGISAVPSVQIEGFLSLREVNFDLIEDLRQLAPFGVGNPKPVFASRSLSIKNYRRIGQSGDHLRLVVGDEGGDVQEALWWRAGDRELPRGKIDLAFTLGVNVFQGERRVQMSVVDVRAVETGDAAEEEKAGILVVDHRAVEDPESEFARLAASGELVVWGREKQGGEGWLQAPAPGKRLVFWVAPPDAETLERLVEAAQPAEVHLFMGREIDETPTRVLQKLAGMLKYALSAYQGRFSPEQLVDASGFSTRTVQAALDWFEAKGMFTFQHQGKRWRVQEGPGEEQQDPSEPAARLKVALEEAAAYRRYYARVVAERLLPR